jgi:dihydroorotase
VKMEDKLGALAVGREADISVLNLMRGRFTLSDNSGEKVIADRMLTPAFALRAGKQVIADSPLIPPAALLAA